MCICVCNKYNNKLLCVEKKDLKIFFQCIHLLCTKKGIQGMSNSIKKIHDIIFNVQF